MFLKARTALLVVALGTATLAPTLAQQPSKVKVPATRGYEQGPGSDLNPFIRIESSNPGAESSRPSPESSRPGTVSSHHFAWPATLSAHVPEAEVARLAGLHHTGIALDRHHEALKRARIDAEVHQTAVNARVKMPPEALDRLRADEAQAFSKLHEHSRGLADAYRRHPLPVRAELAERVEAHVWNKYSASGERAPPGLMQDVNAHKKWLNTARDRAPVKLQFF